MMVITLLARVGWGETVRALACSRRQRLRAWS